MLKGVLTNNDLKEAEQNLTLDERLEKFAGVQINKLGTIKPGEGWIQLVYGPPKSGKTFYAGTAGPRSVYLNTGDGLETLRSPAFTNKYPDSADMFIVDVFEDGGSLAAYDKISRTCGFFIEHRRDDFDTIILDDATSWVYMTMGLAMDTNTQERQGGKARKLRAEEFVRTELSDYNIEMQMTEYWLRKWTRIFKQEGINFILTAHERKIYGKPARQGDEAPLIATVPGFTGKSRPDTIPAFFDDIFHSEVIGGGQVYRFDTRGSDKLIAGTRHGGIFNAVEQDPNFQKMLARIRAAKPAVAPKVTKGS